MKGLPGSISGVFCTMAHLLWKFSFLGFRALSCRYRKRVWVAGAGYYVVMGSLPRARRRSPLFIASYGWGYTRAGLKSGFGTIPVCPELCLGEEAGMLEASAIKS